MESRYGNSSKQIKDVCLVQASFSYRSDQFLTEEIFYSLFSVERTFPENPERCYMKYPQFLLHTDFFFVRKQKPEWEDSQRKLSLNTWPGKTHDPHIPDRKYHKGVPVTGPALRKRTDGRMPFRKSDGPMGALDIVLSGPHRYSGYLHTGWKHPLDAQRPVPK